jgi:hypothetical protein
MNPSENNQNKYSESFWVLFLISLVLPYYLVAKKLFKPSSFGYRLFVALNLLWLLILFLICAKLVYEVTLTLLS